MNEIDFDKLAIRLSQGSHPAPQFGMCVMECVAYIAGEEHTDRPACADARCTSTAIALNDMAPDDKCRQALLPLVLRLAGSQTYDRNICQFRVRLFDSSVTWMLDRMAGLSRRVNPDFLLYEHPGYKLYDSPYLKEELKAELRYLWGECFCLLDEMLKPTDAQSMHYVEGEELPATQAKLADLEVITAR